MELCCVGGISGFTEENNLVCKEYCCSYMYMDKTSIKRITGYRPITSLVPRPSQCFNVTWRKVKGPGLMYMSAHEVEQWYYYAWAMLIQVVGHQLYKAVTQRPSLVVGDGIPALTN